MWKIGVAALSCTGAAAAADSDRGRASLETVPFARPFAIFDDWFAAARAAEPLAEAASLATVGEGGVPALRMVLVKAADARGFAFYTNLESRKGRELAANPRAALCFHWKSLNRQVRIEGVVEPVPPGEADDYFATRPRDSQLGAWASQQSAELDSRELLERRVATANERFPGPVPRPPFWSGFRLRPRLIEFWEERAFRLHERIAYSLEGEAWGCRRLFP